jgi:hypothetical protein
VTVVIVRLLMVFGCLWECVRKIRSTMGRLTVAAVGDEWEREEEDERKEEERK